MTAVLQSSSPHLPSSPSSHLSCSSNDPLDALLTPEGENGAGGGVEISSKRQRRREEREREELSLLALLAAVVRRSLAQCRAAEGEAEDRRRPSAMEIGWPTDVRHVAHVTFDRFHGFLGLPVEFEPEVPRRAPSASATVFGVSTESMQCSYDYRGNSIPTILLLMQRSLYERGGLQAEGIFRINADNSQEEYVRDQLNSGVIPEEIDVHCLAGLIKAWFRELPTGVLDPISPEQVMQCQTDEDCAQIVRCLPPMEAALLDWAINLMADVVQEEQRNKMNARNIAMVFAPNMTQMADPLTALMYAVQVMNFLKMLILKTLKTRQESTQDDASNSHPDPFDENGHHSPDLPLEANTKEAAERVFVPDASILNGPTENPEKESEVDDHATPGSSQTACEYTPLEDMGCNDENPCEVPLQTDGDVPTEREDDAVDSAAVVQRDIQGPGKSKSSNLQNKKGARKSKDLPVQVNLQADKSKGISIITCINPKTEKIEAWR